jgi:protein SCO1/2
VSAPDFTRRLLAAGLALAAAGAAITWKSLRHERPEDVAAANAQGHAATVVDDAQPLPDFALDGPDGKVTRATLAGRWSLLFFGYTHCPDVCPTTLALLAEFNRRLEPGTRPAVLFVSVDPERDTPAVLAAYAPAFDAAFLGASASDAVLAPLAKHLGVQVRRTPGTQAGAYSFDHTASIFLVDPRGRLKAVFSPPFELEAMLPSYRRLTR